jgi:magnesium transporter
MARYIKKYKKEIGLGPDALLFRGNTRIDNVELRIIDYDINNLKENTVAKVKDILKYKDSNTVTWLNIDGLHDEKVMQELANAFQIENMVLANVLNTEGRPMVQEYGNCVFLSIKMLQQDEITNEITAENVSLILTKSVLISFQEKKGDVFNPIRERIRGNKKRIRNSGIDYLTFALLDVIIDNYLHILSLLGDKIEDFEEDVFIESKKDIIVGMNMWKGKLNFFRKNIFPAKEMLLNLPKLESDLIDDNMQVHFKELIHNLNQAIDTSNSYREMLSDQLNIYHMNISSRLNDIIKFLTIFSVIFIPLTFIAGVYGTNFDVLPELHYKYGYYIMIGFMVGIAIVMLIYFKKKKWL